MKVITQIGTKVTIDKMSLIRSALSELEQYQVKIGYPYEYREREVMATDELRREGVTATNPELAYINEYGDPALNIPPRPTLIPGIYSAMPTIIRLLGPAIREVLTKGSPRDSLIIMGRTGRNAVRAYILFGAVRGLAGATLWYRLRAGISLTTPLIETGRMRNALSYMIDRNNQRVFLSDKLREILPASPQTLLRRVGRNIIP
jgi:hypothetical protein